MLRTREIRHQLEYVRTLPDKMQSHIFAVVHKTLLERTLDRNSVKSRPILILFALSKLETNGQSNLTKAASNPRGDGDFCSVQ